MIDYSLDIVEVDGEDRSKRGKRGGRKRLLELDDGSRKILPATAPTPGGASEVLSSLQEQYFSPPDIGALRRRVLDQLHTGDFEL
jgi:nicotinate phosphoribosyltransferase